MEAVITEEALEGHRKPWDVGTEGTGPLWAAEEVEAQRADQLSDVSVTTPIQCSSCGLTRRWQWLTVYRDGN